MRSEQILYGVKDFNRIRIDDFCYVGMTAFARTMEDCANFLFLVRSRRNMRGVYVES